MPSKGISKAFGGAEAASKPDFLCIGAQKSATSWLNKVLLEHPQVFMPPVNELHFFDRVDRGPALRDRQIDLAERKIRREDRKGEAANLAYVDYLAHMISFPTVSVEWYRAAYSWPVAEGVMKGDITPSYLELDDGQVAYAREFLGAARIILIVRRPADRLLSQMRMWAGRHRSEPPSEEDWMAIMRKVLKKENRGAYSKGVPLWRSYFGAENMLILPFSDIRTDPLATIARVEDHIGVPHFDNFTLLTKKIHPTKKYEISDAVKQRAEEATATENDYLRNEFGEEFYHKTR
jgi:hypothetical protein